MCEYWKPPRHVPVDFVTALTIASTSTDVGCYSAGHVVRWHEGWSFTYVNPKSDVEVVHAFAFQCKPYESKFEAACAMANFVWSMNNILNMRD
jgi:hypothetical protein